VLAAPTPSSGESSWYASWISATCVFPERWKVAAATIRIEALMKSANDRAIVESTKSYRTASRLPSAVSSYFRV
jgi:hypothetical protein